MDEEGKRNCLSCAMFDDMKSQCIVDGKGPTDVKCSEFYVDMYSSLLHEQDIFSDIPCLH